MMLCICIWALDTDEGKTEMEMCFISTITLPTSGCDEHVTVGAANTDAGGVYSGVGEAGWGEATRLTMVLEVIGVWIKAQQW